MKKVLLLSVCLIVSCLLGGGKSWAAGNVSFSVADGTLTVSVSGQTTSDDENSFASFLNSASFTKIVFNGGGKVSNDFISKLNNRVYNVTSVDMSGVVVEDLTSSSIPSGFNFANITEFVVPQTKTENGEMVFPKNVFSNYEWNSNNAPAQTKLVFPEGYTKIADEALPESYGFVWLKTLGLPSTLKTIGKKAFMQKMNLTEVTFPENLDKIDDAAFAKSPLRNLKFNSKLRYIGNSAFYLSSQITEETLIIPASVKYIGPSAFNYRQYQEVYFQGNRAPVMPYGTCVVETGLTGISNTAFSSHTLHGNDGFKPNGGNSNHDDANTGWANRENYINDAYFCILHYPKNLTNEDDIDTYVDVTRKYITDPNWDNSYAKDYKVGSETTALKVGDYTAGSYNSGMGYANYGYKDTYLGDQYIWPSQTQWMRAYITAANGVRWDGVTKYRPTLQNWEKAVLAEAGYTTENGYSEDELSKMAHQGTRMFVLARNDEQGEHYNPGNIKKDGTWWTICVPFNMTKKQVLETFGSKTQLCLFRSVTRQIEVNGKNHILIRFDIDPMKYKTADADGKKLKYDANETDGDNYTHAAGEWKYEEIANDNNATVNDDDIAIWAHESYMIKPDDGVNSDQDPVTIVNYEPVPGNPLPSVVRAETVRLTEDDDPDTKDLYRFVGNYESGMTMPQYSYYYGTTKNDKTEKFRFTTSTTAVWKANKSLIQASAHDGGFQDFQNFFGGSAESAAKVKQTTVFGGIDDPNGDTTAIDDVQIVVGNDTLTPIFSLDGKMVSVNGDTTGLAKGIYVKAGKKFIVE